MPGIEYMEQNKKGELWKNYLKNLEILLKKEMYLI